MQFHSILQQRRKRIIHIWVFFVFFYLFEEEMSCRSKEHARSPAQELNSLPARQSEAGA